MSEDADTFVNNKLRIKSCKTAFMGCTLIDTDPASGREANIDSVKHVHQWSSLNSLLLYPTIKEFENGVADDKKQKIDLSMASCWITGLTPIRRGLPQVKNMCQNSANFLDGRSVCTAEQLFKARPASLFNSLFSHIGYFGTGERIIDRKYADDETDNKVVSRGFVARNWKTNPVQARYIVRIPPTNADTYDYVYFIGGSNDIIGNELEKIPANITMMYDQIKVLKEESKKDPQKMSQECEFSSSDPKFIWYAYDKPATAAIVKANLLSKRICRTVQGIIFIRNYLAYAKNGIGISDIDEVVGYNKKEDQAIFEKKNIDDVLKKYDKIYAYCKNLCYVYKDIGKGDII